MTGPKLCNENTSKTHIYVDLDQSTNKTDKMIDLDHIEKVAKKYGVKTGEPLWQAQLKCPSLKILPPNFPLYEKYCTLAKSIYLEYTDLVESFGPDEAWLDVTASTELFGSGEKIAEEIRCRIKTELGLTVSVGVSFNKVFAKFGSDYKKPDATTVITRQSGDYSNSLMLAS